MGLALDGASEFLAIADSGHHRIVFQDDIKAKAGFPAARGELGQENLSIGFANRGQPSPSPATLRFPAGLFYNGHELVAADTGNSRITSYR
jgi:hypothetical protein